jgi:hypothetical protein
MPNSTTRDHVTERHGWIRAGIRADEADSDEEALSLSLRISSSSSMATHIQSHTVTWGGNDHIVSPDLSRSSSIVSIDSILPHKRTTAVQVTSVPASESLAKRMSSLSVEPSGSETLISASTYARADSADDSFTRHHKYFFKDGNVTFLVRGS